MRTASVVTSLVLAVAGAGLAAAPAHAATAITCGATVTGDAYLDADLTCAEGITVVGDADLDLRYHKLTGPGAGDEGAVGIDVAGDSAGAVVVRRGKLNGWDVALRLQEPDRDAAPEGASLLLDRMSFWSDGSGVTAMGDFFEDPANTRPVTVRRSKFADVPNGVTAQFARVRVEDFETILRVSNTALDTEGADVRVTGSEFGGARRYAAYCDGDSTCRFERTTFHDNVWGIDSAGATITTAGSTFTDNDVAYGSNGYNPNVVEGNTFTGNTRAVSFRDAITLTGNTFSGNDYAFVSGADPDESVPVTVSRNTFTGNGDAVDITQYGEVSGNSAVGNTGWGIHAPNATDGGGNTASGNGREPQCTGVICPVWRTAD